MANITTVTRPYAKAVLAIANSQNALVQWGQMLETLALIVQDDQAQKVIKNLAIAPKAKAEFICSVAANAITDDAQNLVKVLAQAKRILILPELFRLYEEMHRQQADIVSMDLTLAQSLNQTDIEELHANIRKDFNGGVLIKSNVNAALIGGGVAQIGNRVIDASVFGRLAAMRNLLRK